MPRVYIDGVFDLYHSGHRDHLRQVKNIVPDVTLLCGVISDADATEYKRRPVFTEKQRLLLISLDKNVDEAMIAPITMTKEFIEKHKIDFVYHAFANEDDATKQSSFYAVPQAMGIFKTIPYNHGVSTTQIIEDNSWQGIWERKGTVETQDLQLLNGYEATAFDPKAAWETVVERLQIDADASVLEVGCGAGYVAQHIKNPYVGVDQSASLVNKHIEVLHNTAIVAGADALPFGNNSFDFVLCTGVLQYFPDKEYTERAVREMQRVARRGIYIGSIRHQTHQARKAKHLYAGPTTHLCHTAAELAAWGFVEQPTFYSPNEYFCVKWTKAANETAD